MKKPILLFATLMVLILTELAKGLSANGTPPVLQDFPWQLDLAYFMWGNILYIRILLFAVLGFLLWKYSPLKRSSIITGLVLLFLWAGIYWLFNHYWVGKKKYKPIINRTFVTAAANTVPLSVPIIGVDWNGVQKAFPESIVRYHHHIRETIGNHPIWVTYCGLCRSGRVYDSRVDGQDLDFDLVGAITWNATFKDKQTGSWWRQETGEAVKGEYKGKLLEDVPMEQISLENWLTKYPNSQILQYDPIYQERYDFLTRLNRGEVSKPKWFRHGKPPLIIGLEIDNLVKAYDWEALQQRRLVMDKVGDSHLLLLSSDDGISPFAYHRTVDGKILEFKFDGINLIDTNTQSIWNMFGYCTTGELQGTQLQNIQIYQQNIRSWKSFHPKSTYYEF